MRTMVDIDSGVGSRRGAGHATRWLPRQTAVPLADLDELEVCPLPGLDRLLERDCAAEPLAGTGAGTDLEPMLGRLLDPGRPVPIDPPTLPDLPVLPDLAAAAMMPTRPDVNPLAGRHVVVVGIHYAPEPTGVAPYTTAMAEYLATRARLVTVLTGLPHYPTWHVPAAFRRAGHTEELHGPSLNVVRHTHAVPRRMTPLSVLRYQAGFALRASRTTLPEKPDLIIAVTPSASSAIAGARLAERYGCPLVTVVQDLAASRGRLAEDLGTGAMVSGRPTGTIARLEAAALCRADRVVVRSEAMVGAVTACGVAENRVDAVPIWPAMRPSPLTRNEARKRLGWARDRFTVVYCGDMGPAQGLDTVLDAARELERREVQASFVLAGDGESRRALQLRLEGGAARSVRLVDQVGPDDASTMLAAADLLVLSETPGVGVGWLPGVAPGYLAAGRAIVAAVSPLGVVGRELVRSRAGQLVEPGDAGLLADAIEGLNRSREQRIELASAALAYADTAYDRSEAMRGLETTVARVLAGI